jgi:ketosteroid isomerase-like protein
LTNLKIEYQLSEKKTCPYCQSQIKNESEIIYCEFCGTPHHSECWNENNGCTTYGCRNNPVTEKKPETGINIGDRTIAEIQNMLDIKDTDTKTKLIECNNCKNQVDINSIYCKYCGSKINEDIKPDISPIEKEFQKNYKDNINLKKKSLYFTYTSFGILTILLLVVFYVSYKIIDNRINSDEIKIKNLIYSWNSAFKNKEPEKLKSLIDKDFIYYDKNGNELNFEKRFKQLSGYIKNEKYKTTFVTDVQFKRDSISENYALITFKQNFYSDKESKSENRYFKLYKDNDTGKWRIFREYYEF